MADALLGIRNLSCSIGGRAILREINLEVHEGETVVLLGRSGSGKTTLLKTVNGLIAAHLRAPSNSKAGPPPIGIPSCCAAAWATSYRMAASSPTGPSRQTSAWYPASRQWPPERIAPRVDELLTAVGLAPAEFRARYPRELSGGQKQRVGIARALAADPPLLLFDEPFAALDPITRLDLQRLFLELRRTVRKTALFVTHDIREAMMLASRIALLKDGALDLLAEPREFRAAETPEARAFLAGLEPEPGHGEQKE